MNIPVINLACDMQHPTQAMADIMVLKENIGDLKGKKFVAHWAYSPIVRYYTSTQADALIAATYGMDVTVTYPEGYDLDLETESLIRDECAKPKMNSRGLVFPYARVTSVSTVLCIVKTTMILPPVPQIPLKFLLKSVALTPAPQKAPTY